MATATLFRGGRRSVMSSRAIRSALYFSDPPLAAGVAPQPLPPVTRGMWARSMSNTSCVKPFLNVLTFGPIGHGKSTLTYAVSKIVEEDPTYQAVSHVYPKTASQQEPAMKAFQFETIKRRFAYLDCPGPADHLKVMIMGGVKVDTAILIASAPDCPVEEIKDHILLARQVGIPSIICFLNKVDVMENPKAREMIEVNLQELLSNYPGNNVPVICGSALAALQGTDGVIGRTAIVKLIDTLDDIQIQGSDALSIVKAPQSNDIEHLMEDLLKQKGRLEQNLDLPDLSSQDCKIVVMTNKQLASLFQLTYQVAAAHSEKVACKVVASVDERVKELKKASDEHRKVTTTLVKKTRTQGILHGINSVLMAVSMGVMIFVLWKLWGLLSGFKEYLSNNVVVSGTKKAWDKTKEGWAYITSFFK